MRQKLKKWLNREREELKMIEKELSDLSGRKAKIEAVISGLETILNALPEDNDEPLAEINDRGLRKGSLPYYVRETLRQAGKPLHVELIISRLKNQVKDAKKTSLVGQLGGYVREDRIFTRPGPNIFGLKEFEINQLQQRNYEILERERAESMDPEADEEIPV